MGAGMQILAGDNNVLSISCSVITPNCWHYYNFSFRFKELNCEINKTIQCDLEYGMLF